MGVIGGAFPQEVEVGVLSVVGAGVSGSSMGTWG